MCDRDVEHWHKVVTAFEDAPEAAYRLARALNFVREALNEDERHIVDDLIDGLFPYTNFYDSCRRLYWLAVEGKLQPEHDPVLAAFAADPTWPPRRVAPKSENERLIRGRPKRKPDK